MDGPIRKNRRIRLKPNTRQPTREPEPTAVKDKFEHFDYDAVDFSSSESSASEDESMSLSFPTRTTSRRNVSFCQDMYVKSCRHFNTVPSTYFFRRLKRSHIKLSHHGLGIDGVKSVAVALVSNTSVQSLDISANDIRSEGLKHILQTLEENHVITDLNLSYNNLGPEGAVLLGQTFSTNTSVTRLDISANGFDENDADSISAIIRNNSCLKSLIISKNRFRENGGEIIAKALEINTTLRHIDLSWNHLRQRGAVAICLALQNNTTLESINLGWNGFGIEGCHEMGRALLINKTLLELDLSSNRVSLDAFRQLLVGVSKNKTLKVLKIGLNPLTTDGALAVLQSIVLSESALEEIDLTDVSVDESFLELLNEIKGQRNIRVIHGIVLRHDEITKGPRRLVLDTDDPMTILFEYMKQKNLRLIDLLHNLDRDHSDTLTRDEFQRGMTSIDLPLSSRALDILMKKLDINQDGQVDYEELNIKHKEYQRRVTKLKMQAAKGGLKFYKGFDKLEQLREAVRLRIALSTSGEGQK